MPSITDDFEIRENDAEDITENLEFMLQDPEIMGAVAKTNGVILKKDLGLFRPYIEKLAKKGQNITIPEAANAIIEVYIEDNMLVEAIREGNPDGRFTTVFQEAIPVKDFPQPEDVNLHNDDGFVSDLDENEMGDAEDANVDPEDFDLDDEDDYVRI